MTVYTRESWLLALAERVRVNAASSGHAVPSKLRVTCGWPSKGGLGKGRRVTGECWYPEHSADGTTEVFVSPVTSKSREACQTLAHELAHAVVGPGHKHGKEWKAVARALGAVPKAFHAPEDAGKLSDALHATLAEHVLAWGEYPHTALAPGGKGEHTPKKQTTRMLPFKCHVCGYAVRTTQKWVDVAVPVCPVDEVALDRDSRKGGAE